MAARNDGDHNSDDQQSSQYSSTDTYKDWYRRPVEYQGEYPYFIGIGPWSVRTSGGSEDDTTSKQLSPLEIGTIISLVEDTVDELVILKYVIGAPIVSSWDFMYKPPEEKLRRRLTPFRIFPEVDSTPFTTPPLKLQRDREYIETVIRRLLRGLMDDWSYEPLVSALQDLQRQSEDDENLVQSLKKNLLYMKELSANVKEKRRLDDLEEKGRDELMYQLQDEMDDIILMCDVEERFVNKWETVRNSQNQLRLRNIENYYKENISKFNAMIKIEKRVTNEFQAYLKLNQTELEEELEAWMTKYDTEIDRRENKILHLKYSRDQAVEKKNSLRQLYEERTQEMKDWVAFRDLRKRRSAASFIIQCWWRGVMVRKKLGPYKPRKVKETNTKGRKKK